MTVLVAAYEGEDFPYPDMTWKTWQLYNDMEGAEMLGGVLTLAAEDAYHAVKRDPLGVSYNKAMALF